MEIEEQTIESVTNPDGRVMDLWILGSVAAGHVMFEVPHGEEPQVEKFSHVLETMVKWGADECFLAKVTRRYVPHAPALVAAAPTLVQ